MASLNGIAFGGTLEHTAWLENTLVQLMGLDHERLTFYHRGLGRRLTNVNGGVLQDVLA